MPKRVLVLADVSNLYYCVGKRFNGGKLNYQKLLRAAIGDNELYRAIAYGAEIEDEAANFKAALRSFGYEPKYKQPRVYPIQGREFRKADWDVGIAMDVVKMLDNVDIVVYCSADGDLAPSLEYVQFRGKQTHVLACGISRDLKDVCNKWTEIVEELLEV